ncbi:MAG: hypothetical protein ACOCRN_03025 [Spirochaetia bacterium]
MVLSEIRRVLKPEGRVGIVSMSKAQGASLLLRLYEWLHRTLPELLDCRPIYCEQSLREAGFQIRATARIRISGLPGGIVIATKG